MHVSCQGQVIQLKGGFFLQDTFKRVLVDFESDPADNYCNTHTAHWRALQIVSFLKCC